jgi:uncharacterized GH25 family protein
MRIYRRQPPAKKRIAWMYALLAGMIFSFSPDAFSHSLFIQSGRHLVSEGKESPLFFCYGHHFPVDDAIRREKFAYIRIIAPDRTETEVALRKEKSLHSYLVHYDQPGVYALAAETVPGFFAMYIDKRGRKRHSLKPLNTFSAKAEEILSSLRSSQWAKAYVLCEKASGPFPARIGLPMELVPAADLFALKPGDQLELQVYNEGNPYEGPGFWDATYTGFSTEAEDLYIQRTPASTGRFVLPIDVAGRWFVRFFTKTPAPEDHRDAFLEEKRTATLVFEVRNPRKRPEQDGH